MAQQYPKRPGTSGIRGQLYETKLLSLIYFRAIHDDGIEEFHLATNVDKLGSFDDICFRAKFKGNDKPLAVFIQAKHRENNNSVLTLNKTELVEYFNSYLTITHKFSPNNRDVMFNGTLNETECVFVIYTTAKGDKKSSKYEGSFSEHLNALIRTGEPGSQPPHDNSHEELLCGLLIEDQMTALARQMAKCILGELNDYQMLMQDAFVLRYHAILGQKAFHISEIQPEGHRNLSFRDDFFDIDEEYLRLFKDELCTEILKRRSRDNPTEFKALLYKHILLSEITDTETLYKQFGSLMIYESGKFVLLDKNAPKHFKLFLDKFNESQENIRKTVEMAVKEYLPSRTYKVPASFGNKDLTIKGSDIKIERKLNDLAVKILRFINQSKPCNIVTIDDTFGEGFLQLSGGIASAVGNLLVFDGTSKLMKFNDNYESLGNLSKRLYRKLKEKIDNLNEYKFDVKAKVFPKLSFTTDAYNKTIVSDFLRTLLFFTSQYNEKAVEESLINEINNCQGDDVQHVEVTSDAIFLKYHDEIQKWSMESKVEMGTYLEKEGNLYKDAETHATTQPLMGVMNMMQRIKSKHYTFRTDHVNAIKFDDLSSGTIIVTENSALTIAKLIKHFNYKNAVVLDLEYVSNLSARDDRTLRRELMNTNEVKTLIVAFNNAQINNRLKNMVSSMQQNIIIIITDQNSVANAKKYFSQTGDVIKDEIKLIDMSEESQKRILENTKVIFQGYELSLDQILINGTIGYVEGNVLYKMMHSEKATVGKPVSNLNDKPKLYIQRSVRPFCRNTGTQESDDRKQIQTLDALEDDVVIIFGDPGIGKSTLLTHLSIKTKENDANTRWIVRVNLLEHTRQFRKWKDKETNIDTMEALKFLCQVALSKTSKTNEMNITLVQCIEGIALVTDFTGDAWTLFELRLFLTFYNSAQLIILFDGFDEICPTYANEVLALIKSVKNFSKTHKMWITSRSYDKVQSNLENLKFAKLFEIEPLNAYELDLYLSTFWDEREIQKDLNDKQFANISDCITYVLRKYVFNMLTCKRLSNELKEDMPYFLVGLSLLKYLKINLSNAPAAVTKIINDAFEICFMNPNPTFVIELVATPLHLNILADYFYSKIKEINIKRKTDWYWDCCNFDVYEYYLETKLKKIRFQEKTQNDMSKPDNITAYDREYADSIDKHRKLAAYAIYYGDRSKLFDDAELNHIVDVIAKLKEGQERTGIITNVVDDIPMFVHSTIQEYLVVEYICDLIKSKGNQIPVWDFILNVMFFGNLNVMIALNNKMTVDHELPLLFEQNRKIIFDLLMKQGKNREHGEIKSSLCEAIRCNLRNLVCIFIPIMKDTLNESNLMVFIEIARDSKMLLLALDKYYKNIAATVVNHVKRIDMSKLSVLFVNIELNENVAELSTDDLLQKLERYVSTLTSVIRAKHEEARTSPTLAECAAKEEPSRALDSKVPAVIRSRVGSSASWALVIAICENVMSQEEVAEREREILSALRLASAEGRKCSLPASQMGPGDADKETSAAPHEEMGKM